MKFLASLFGKSPPLPPKNIWPNQAAWGALKNEVPIQTDDGPRHLWTIPCGELALPSGRLAVCDPFVFLSPSDTPFIFVPKGRFPVIVTLADVSETLDRSHIREAYASIIFSPQEEAYRKCLPLAIDGQDRPELTGDEFVGFGVDAGTACFVDESLIRPCMPAPETWYEDLFENERDDCWFKRMDDPAHIRAGIANIKLPRAQSEENLILFHSGWGDGCYPVIGSFDSKGDLVSVHIDFFVVK